MGDAGPLTPLPAPAQDHVDPELLESQGHVRDIHVLVTGFGPFKSFAINPSWLIASALSDTLDPERDLEPPNSPNSPRRRPDHRPYRIHVHTHPTSIRVSYSTVVSAVPMLLSPAHNPTGIDYDYILHIGLASGRSSYTLETIAHRDFYKIKDVDDQDGFLVGEFAWKRDGVPEKIEVGWDPEDVLRRWERTVEQQEDAHQEAILARWEALQRQRGSVNPAESRSILPELFRVQQPPVEKRAVVKLSRDAGRFLCEFILMTSLIERWRGTYKATQDSEYSGGDDFSHGPDDPIEKLGKVAFLHVPNGITVADVARGKRVAEAAIRAFVASWEDGYRNPRVYQPLEEPIIDLKSSTALNTAATVSAQAYEAKGTGDA